MKIGDISILGWIEENSIRTEDGKPFDIKSHFFMFDILSDMASLEKDIVVYKAAQIGFSTTAIIGAFWIAKKRGADIIYTLPTGSDVKQFAGGKINRIVSQNPVLQEWVKEKDTVEQKTVGESIIYYRGTWSEKSAMMVSSDVNIYDEVDASNQNVIEQYATRLQHSNIKREWYFSHPSVEGNGVSKKWELSDQKHWFITCPHCTKKQYMSYPESFNIEKEIYICKHCSKEIDNETRRKGEWIAKYKKRKMSGYWIPLFICPWVSASEILEYKRLKSEEYFTNKVEGLPYTGEGNKVTWDMLKKCINPAVNLQEGRIVIGVDTGITHHYVVGNETGIFHYDSGSYEDIEKLLKRWPNSIAVFDQGGDLVGSRELREKYPGRVFLCHYARDRKTMQLVRWGSNKEEGNVIADRNRMIQLMVDEIKSGLMRFNGTEEEWYNYYLHWKNVYRTSQENSLGQLEFKWERSGDDHFVHATNYWRIGMSRFGGGEGFIVSGKQNFKSAPTVNPDDTIPAVNPKNIWKFN